MAGVSPGALTFGNQTLGTTSASQPVTLSNTGDAALTITSTTTSTNFAQTNTCGGSLAASGSCTINVTFSPTATGPLTGALTVTDNSNGLAGSTQTVTLSGTGTAPLVGWVDDFEEYPIGSFPSPDWTYSGNSGISVQPSPDGTGGQCVQLYGLVGGCWGALIHRPLNTVPPLTIQFRVFNGSEVLSGCHPFRGTLELNTQATWDSPGRILITFDGTANVRGAPNTTDPGDANSYLGGAILGTYASNEWMKVKLGYEVPDASTVRVSYWINDEFKGSDTHPISPYEAQLGYLSVAVGEGTAWFDDIGVTPGVSTGGTPAVSLSPPSLTFGNQNLGTTSGSQAVTLSNTGNAALTITDIATSANFGQTNNCGNGVAASGSCTINLTFSPTATGPLTGTLTITDNSNGVAGSTQSVALSGTGQDFTMAVSSGSSTSASVAPGGTATYSLTITSLDGFNQAVNFTCSGAPSDAPCQLSANSLTPSSSGTTLTVSVATIAPSVSAPRSRHLPPVPPLSGLRGLLMLALVLAAMAWAIGRRNQPGVSRWRSTMVPLASALLLTLALAGCGGGGGSANVTHNPGTLRGTYTLTVTGTAGSGSSALSHSVTLTLIVS